MNTPAEECWMKVSEIQKRLAKKAIAEKTHRFTKLYDLLTYEPLLSWAFDVLMTNRGARTAGIDGMNKAKAVAGKDKLLADLRAELKTQTYRHQPVRRVYIPKANGKRRPLGIPTLKDRVVQMMVKMVVEPIFEADFVPESHGFRPNRSCHTAMAHLHLRTAPKHMQMHWVIEGDITGCFDHIQHAILIKLLKRRIQDRRLIGLIDQMLKAGVMEDALFKQTDEGTPQGGVMSPLLANIYLHELDQWFHKNYLDLNYNEKNRRRRKKKGNACYFRYADDFVVGWNGPKDGAEALKAALATFLKEQLGLELSADKTQITHDSAGYDFLGFTVKRHIDEQRGYNELVIYPSKKSVMKVKDKIKAMTCRGTTMASVRDKIDALNYLLRGWANYFRHHASSNTFDYVGSYAFMRMEIWLRHKTGIRSRRALYGKFYRKHATANGIAYLTWHASGKSLFNPGVETRIEYKRYVHGKHPYLNTTMKVLPAYHHAPLNERVWTGDHTRGEEWTAIREQALDRGGYVCQLCGSDDRVEVHHIRKFKPNAEHNLMRLIPLCASCHRKARNPQGQEAREITRRQT